MNHQFWKVTPSGNPTILLKAEDVPPARRAEVANAVMSAQHIGGEQVGYVRLEGTPRLDMMGGEFCLNATRAFASVLDSLGLLERAGDVSSGLVEVSGVDEKVAVRVTHSGNALPFAEACLHFEELPQPEHLPGGLRLLRVPGIAHIVQGGAVPSSSELSAFCSEQRRALTLEGEEAVGHLWLDVPEDASTEGEAALDLSPVVWVRDTATLCFESACGSGTLACALAEHARTGAVAFSITQPSGMALSVRIEKKESGFDVWVGGPSRITASGETDLSGIL
jgi:diaminopimelate epimerase